MRARSLVTALAIFAIAFTILPSAHAVSASNFTLDRSSYNPGDSGTATITVYNDQQSLIRITSITLSMNYYYTDGRVYAQDFTSPALSMNVSSASTSQPITVQFSLPSSIAVGYFTPGVTISYQVLNGGIFGNPRQANSQASTPLLIASTSSQQTLMYVFVATTLLFAAIAGYFAMRYSSVKTPANRPRTD